MYTTHEISVDEHRSWFERIKADPTKRYFLYLEDDEPLGVIAFTDIHACNKTAAWAFYAGEAAPRGTGSRMELAALDHAFDTLGLEKLWCEVLAFNTAVLELHRKFGFQEEGVFRSHHVAGTERVDVHRLAILRSDWTPAHRDAMLARIAAHARQR
jgi:UDP-4-amino-4,6-dideoxy-N-acetyl-beta-L-altrosamine N-acetyltransferase